MKFVIGSRLATLPGSEYDVRRNPEGLGRDPEEDYLDTNLLGAVGTGLEGDGPDVLGPAAGQDRRDALAVGGDVRLEEGPGVTRRRHLQEGRLPITGNVDRVAGLGVGRVAGVRPAVLGGLAGNPDHLGREVGVGRLFEEEVGGRGVRD